MLGLLSIALLAGCGDEPAGPPPPPATVSLYEALADPYAPARRPIGRAELVSSREPDAPGAMENLDYDHFVRIDGGEKVLIDEEGPGGITRIWITMRGAES